MSTPQDGLGNQRAEGPVPGITSMPIMLGYVVGSDRTKRTVDIVLVAGGILFKVPVMGSLSGVPYVPTIPQRTSPAPQSGDVQAVVGYLGGDARRPVCLGLIFPETYPDNGHSHKFEYQWTGDAGSASAETGIPIEPHAAPARVQSLTVSDGHAANGLAYPAAPSYTLPGVIWRGGVPSSNFAVGRNSVTVDRIVIHHMDGGAAGSESRFRNPASIVSAHYGVLQSGDVWQWVDTANTAYQAGDMDYNRRSVGIEHEDMHSDTFTDIEYAASAKLVKELCTAFSISIDTTHIVRHRDIVATACPGVIDLNRIIRQAAAL